ncbi:MAG: hypothetical protein ACFE0I_21535 [Elainellaceae cyanobacterium]
MSVTSNRFIARLSLSSMLVLSTVGILALPARALPDADESPEEILRSEIILDVRSPIDGEPISAAEYAELQVLLEESEYPPSVSSDIQQLIFLLRVRRFIRIFVPIFP